MIHSCAIDSITYDMTLSYVTWLIHVWHHSFICDMSRSYVTWLILRWHDSTICDITYSYVTWLIHMWHVSFICDMTHSYAISATNRAVETDFFQNSWNHEKQKIRHTYHSNMNMKSVENMSHVTYEWVMSHMKSHMWISRFDGTYFAQI